jgi:thiamine phosphate synthase YjbQ (UPF0047 family)
MFSALRSKVSRRQFVAFTLLAVIVVVGAHYSLVTAIAGKHAATTKAWLETATQLTGGLFAGVITSAFLVFVAIYLYPAENELALYECADPERTHHLHQLALEDTDFWYHDGHIARWVRTEGMKKLEERARHTGSRKEIRAIILDPAHDGCCTAYSNYRRLIGYKEKGFSSLFDTKAEILASIMVIGSLNESRSGLTASIYLKQTFNPTRLDISSRAAFRTLVKPRSPAIVHHRADAANRHGFFEAALIEFEEQIAVAKKFVAAHPVRRSRISAAIVLEFIRDNPSLGCPNDMEFAELVAKKTSSHFNPYN